jgi:hypothetical protein
MDGYSDHAIRWTTAPLEPPSTFMTVCRFSRMEGKSELLPEAGRI